MEEFKKLSEMLEQIHCNFISANNSFMVWRSLENCINPEIVGIDKATNYIASMNRFKIIPHIILPACKDIYLLDLAKCFDSDKGTLSIRTVLTFAKVNISKLNYENYIAHSGKIITLNKEDYSPITPELLKECFEKITGKSKIIRRLMNFRNGYLGHNQLNPNKDSSITIQETEELMKLLMEIGNTLSLHLFRATWWHNFSDKNIYEETERLLDFLHRFESYRIQEIKHESQKLIEEYNKK